MQHIIRVSGQLQNPAGFLWEAREREGNADARAQDDVCGAHWSMRWLLLARLDPRMRARRVTLQRLAIAPCNYCARGNYRRSSREQMPVVFIRRARIKHFLINYLTCALSMCNFISQSERSESDLLKWGLKIHVGFALRQEENKGNGRIEAKNLHLMSAVEL